MGPLTKTGRAYHRANKFNEEPSLLCVEEDKGEKITAGNAKFNGTRQVELEHDSAESDNSTSDNAENKNFSKRRIAKKACLTAIKTAGQVRKREAGTLPKPVIDQLNQVRSTKIISVQVVRTPLHICATKAMELISFGKYDLALQESPYDSMFHLSLLLNDRYTLHKCEVVKFVDDSSVTNNSETMDVPPPQDGTTFFDLFDRAGKAMGKKEFTNYHPRKNNCQDFVVALLKASSLLTQEVETFVKQDAEEIFRRLPLPTTFIAKAVTDGAAVSDKLVEDVKQKLHEKESPGIEEFKRLAHSLRRKGALSKEWLHDFNDVLAEENRSLSENDIDKFPEQHSSTKNRASKGLAFLIAVKENHDRKTDQDLHAARKGAQTLQSDMS